PGRSCGCLRLSFDDFQDTTVGGRFDSGARSGGPMASPDLPRAYAAKLCIIDFRLPKCPAWKIVIRARSAKTARDAGVCRMGQKAGQLDSRAFPRPKRRTFYKGMPCNCCSLQA